MKKILLLMAIVFLLTTCRKELINCYECFVETTPTKYEFGFEIINGEVVKNKIFCDKTTEEIEEIEDCGTYFTIIGIDTVLIKTECYPI